MRFAYMRKKKFFLFIVFVQCERQIMITAPAEEKKTQYGFIFNRGVSSANFLQRDL